MRKEDIHKAIKILIAEVRRWNTPAVGLVAERTRDPFKVLVSCILSLRTKDRTTEKANDRLFALGSTPEEIAGLPFKKIEKAIFPVGFYRIKAKTIKGLSKTIINKYRSKVPDDMDELLKLKGVGRKTANLVLTLGYGKLGICVDTHVHRIVNRWGYARTKNPFETEIALREKLPKKYWIEINNLLVLYGQNICKPISPLCSKCRLFKYCKRVGVGRSR
ncbi:MAG: endonuclease III [Nitrospirota bacterium]|jgi:endonuclease-3